MKARLFLASCLLPLCRAFSDTAPLLAWSSSDQLVPSVPLVSDNVQNLYSVLYEAELCGFDALVLIDQPGLRANDLSSLSPSSALARKLNGHPHFRNEPNVRHSALTGTLEAAEGLARRCGANLAVITADDEWVPSDTAHKHVVYVKMPSVRGVGRWRKDIMAEHERTLSHLINLVEKQFASHFFLYMGSPLAPYWKRQAPSADDLPSPFAFAPKDSDGTSGGILTRYQVLTPGLITSLLAVFFLIVPIIVFAIHALASIQSPVRLDAPKIPSQEKKNQ